MIISNFLADQLDKIAKNEGFLDYKIDGKPGSNHGDGFLATMLAVTLIGKRKIGNTISESKLELMCKCLPKNLDRREAFHSSSIFKREIYIYTKVLSAFDRFQQEKNVPLEDRFTEYPKCYAAFSDMESDEHVIIMENLKSVGYDLWDKTKPIDYQTVCLYMHALGKFHALSFALRDKKPGLFDELSDFQDIFLEYLEKNDNPFVRMLKGTCDRALSLLDQPNELKVMQNLRDHCKEICVRVLDKKLAAKFNVLGHGDSWNNNLFYSNEGSIESLDDHSGRLLIKLALGGTREWFNEFMVQPVSKAEYAQYGKVINSAKYEEYKKKQEEKEQQERLRNVKIEKVESSSSKTNVDRQNRPKKDNSRSTDDERNVGSSDRKNHQSNRNRYSGSSGDEGRLSKSHSYKRDSSADRTNRRPKSCSSYKESTRKNSDQSSDENDDDNRRKHSSSHKSSHKKTKSKKHFKSRSYSKDHRQRYASSDEDEKHHKKKTKKSKRPRSRSRDRR